MQGAAHQLHLDGLERRHRHAIAREQTDRECAGADAEGGQLGRKREA
jgi:hypothetical protein